MRIKEIDKKRYKEVSASLPSHGSIEGITVKFESCGKTFAVVTSDAFDNSFRITVVYELIKQTSEDGTLKIIPEQIAEFEEDDVSDHFDIAKCKHHLIVALIAREKR